MEPQQNEQGQSKTDKDQTKQHFFFPNPSLYTANVSDLV